MIVQMKFDDDIPVEYHGKLMFDFEALARKMTGLRIEVFKHARGDDSKLRALMTKEQRAKL